MTLNEYQKLAQRTSPDGHDKLLMGAIGMCGEAGEFIDIVKKVRFQGHLLDTRKLIEELGDVLFYCAEAAVGLGITLEEAAQRNIEKLRRRYPDGFSVSQSMNREAGG